MIERKILQVRELTALIRVEIERRFSDFWVEGEVANLKIPSSGHLYFTLKDGAAQIKAIIFRSHGRFLKFSPKEGQSVLIRGHLTLYEARGEYQLIVDYIEPRGAGALQAAFEALKERLRLEGLFDVERKKPIPLLPRKIGLITSPTGAALRDILKVVWGRDLPFQILIYPTAVQGEGAAEGIARAVDEMNRMSGSARSGSERIDLLVLARGGGSIEDLWAFNEEIVARAVARSRIPIISAIGHETDSSIADFVSDLRAPTPSIAAETIVRNGRAVLENFGGLIQRLEEQMRGNLQAEKEHLRYETRLLIAPRRQIGHFSDQVDHLTIRLRQASRRLMEGQRRRQVGLRQNLTHLNPIERLRAFRRRLSELGLRLPEVGRESIARQKTLLRSDISRLDILSPLNILGRGYSITRKLPALKVVRRASDVSLHDRLQIILHQGKIIARVEEREE